MRRSELIRRLEKLGFEIKEGGKHTGIYKEGKRLSTLSRSKEIAEKMVMIIERQIGQKIK